MASSRPDSTPICRCRVLYLGSAVPHITKDGLQGIQEPLRELYPEQGALGARGIDSWLSVWSNGILLENVDENHKKVTRFFPIETLHYCAAVRYVLVPEKSPVASSSQPRFLPLDSPFARSPNPDHPPLFACILRRTTGIKVLECHTFICKREMAANALVRCCFHAYADSAYARHMDSGGNPNSVYGTLRREENNQEGWRSPVGGSTLTLDSALHSSPRDDVDDASLYNGDENHKIWAGSVRDVSAEDPVYGEYSGDTVRSGRSSRPRQSVNAPPPPPPPAKEEKRTKKAEKERARRKKMTGGSREEMYPLMNGSLLRSNTVSSRGSAFYRHYSDGTMRGGGPPYPGPVVMVPATLPHPRPGKTPPLLVVPPPFVGHPLYPRRPSRHHVEEPVYMPSNRPMSPVSSYQPCHFPHEAYLMRQYAAEDPKRKNKRDKRSVEPKRERDDWSEYSRRNKEDDSESPCEAPSRRERTKRSDEEDGESPYDTGIYRRKGHLNERAFSYSIRQEHRSRSYGSLANLKFAPLPVVPNGGGPPPEAQYYASKEEMKKEREIMQMMRDLELSGDELERSEVPAGVYRQARQRSAKIRR